MAASKVFTGCRARFQLNGVTVGYAKGVTLREGITYEPIKVMDSIHVKEHAAVDYDCSLTAAFVRIVGQSLKTQGWFPKQGTSAQDHLNNILSTGELTAVIIDNATGTIVRNVEGVKVQEANMSIEARGVVAEDATFVAILARDEGDISP